MNDNFGNKNTHRYVSFTCIAQELSNTLKIKFLNTRRFFLQKGNFWESQNSPGWKGYQKTVWYSLSWKREPQWHCLASCSFAPWKPPVKRTLPHGEVVPVIDCTHCKRFVSYMETSSGITGIPCPFSSPCGSLRRESLCPLCSHALKTEILWWSSSLNLLFSREKRSNSFSVSSQGRFSSPLIIKCITSEL